MQIGGTNMAGTIQSVYSYGFSKFTLPPWGWASWARAWEKYDFFIRYWEDEIAHAENWLGTTFPLWERIINSYRLKLNSWDVQWNLTLWRHEGLSVIPTSNLVSNIGCGGKATFTKLKLSTYSNMRRTTQSMPLRHPSSYVENFDNFIEPNLFRFFQEISEFNQ